MKEKRAAVAAAVCIMAVLLGGCTVDVNSLANVSSAQSSVSSDTDSETRSAFYKNDTDSAADTSKTSDTDTSSDTDTQTASAFDESKYLPMFVSGAAKIQLYSDALYGSDIVGELNCGDRVSVVRRDVMEYCFVYSADLSAFGYVRKENLADYLEETTIGDVFYVKPASAQVYSDIAFTESLETVSMNDMLTVIVKRADGKWRVADKEGKIGYIDKSLLSEKRVKNESSKAESSKKTSSKAESSKAISKAESSKIVSSREASRAVSSAASSEETVSGLYTGTGQPPEEYETYIIDVDVGYLSLRAKPSADSKTIGELYLDERVYAIDTSGDYWYIYSPKLGKYGYVTGDLNYLYPEYYDD